MSLRLSRVRVASIHLIADKERSRKSPGMKRAGALETPPSCLVFRVLNTAWFKVAIVAHTKICSGLNIGFHSLLGFHRLTFQGIRPKTKVPRKVPAETLN